MYSFLQQYGLGDRFEQEAALYQGLFLARVSEQHRNLYKVISEAGELNAGVAGRLMYLTDDPAQYPSVGDWVMIDRADDAAGHAVIHHVLRRKSVFLRKAAGTENEQQVIAANIDIVFICTSLNADFNLRRIERYLTIAWDSMALPVIVLTKSDLCEDLGQKLNEIATVSKGADVVACSAENEHGYEAIHAFIAPGKTIALIGSSGVGKSTLINRLMGRDIIATQGIREDDGKGRHTTTYRQLLLLPSGGIVIDTPGMRELQVSMGNLAKAFEDIDELAALCKYKNCTHSGEPGCMVRQAIQDGTLAEKRLENYQKIQREISYDGLNARQLENEKINRMFGGKAEMKQALKYIKNKNNR